MPEETQAQQKRLQQLVDKLQIDPISSRRDVAEISRQRTVAVDRTKELEQQLEEVGENFTSDMLSFVEEQRKAVDEARARERALEDQLRQSTEPVVAADAEQTLFQLPFKSLPSRIS